jgi:hypothetical protein
MHTRRWLAAIAVCFAARLAFYASAYPLWEGYDEWAHFGAARAIAFEGRFLAPRDTRLPRDVEESLKLVPMPPNLHDLPPEALSHEAFWALPAETRRAREEAFRAIPRELARQPGTTVAYEALQPPVYYWLMAPSLRLSGGATVVTQVFLLRWISILLAVSIVPLVFLVARSVFVEDRVALACAAVVALMPELAIDVSRVGNECVAVPLYSAVTWLALRRRNPWLLGALLGVGLLTKAYFLAALAGIALAYWVPQSLAVAVLISGWWYARNLWTTGTLSGLSESVMLRGTPVTGALSAVAGLPWRTAIDSILLSHLYFGGWSSLTARSWMYHLLYALIAVAAVGVVLLWRKREIRALAAVYGVFWLAQLYNVVLIYRAKGVPTSMGWYLYAVIGAQATLALAGLRRLCGSAAIWIGALLFGLLDLYAMHALALPYYAGMLRRKPGGGLAGLRWSDFDAAELFRRLAAFKPPFVTEGVLIASWALYVAATIVLVAAAIRLARGVKRA